MTEGYELTPQAAEEAVSLFKRQKGNPIEWDWLEALWSWLKSIWDKLWAIAAEAAAWVWSYVGPWLTSIVDWVRSVASQVANLASQLWNTISDVVSSWVTKVWGWIQEVLAKITQFFTALGASIANYFTDLWGKITGAFTSLGSQIAIWVTELPKTLEREFIDPITDWFQGFIENIVAIPVRIFQEWKRWLIDFPMFMLEDFGERVIYGLSTSFQWIGQWAEAAAGNVIEAIIGYIQKVGRIDPTNAPTVAGALMSLVGTGVFALSAMTIAGELMHPLKEIGMGHVSAMIGDVINYRVISGAFMGALVGAALSTPLRYYFNYTLRPWLPDRRVINEAMSRDMFGNPEDLNPELAPQIRALVGPGGWEAFERRMLGYHGFADEWYAVYKELANTRVGYFALAAVSRDGTFDEPIFKSELMRGGYGAPTRAMLLDMYRRASLGEVKGLYIGDPISAFKEGWFDEARLSRELIECGIPEASLPRYLHAAWIKYEVDLLSDRLAGLKEAYRKGLVTDDNFLGALTTWGMVTERATEHLTREQIRRYGKL